MIRRYIPWLAAAALLAGCAPQESKPLFPREIADMWDLKESLERPVSEAPEPVRRFGVRSVREAVYGGMGRIRVTVYEMNSDASGLELQQTWKPVADTVVFHRGRYFAVVKWDPGADRTGVTAFIREMEKRLGEE